MLAGLETELLYSRPDESLTLFNWVLGLLVEEGAVWLVTSLGLSLPVAGSHLPLLGPDVHVTVYAVLLGTVSLLRSNTQWPELSPSTLLLTFQ